MKKVYFPQEDVTDVIVCEGCSPTYSPTYPGKHVGFTYEIFHYTRRGKHISVKYAIVKNNNGEEKFVSFRDLVTP